MKINLEFYETTNSTLKNLITEFEGELNEFKQICDAIFMENKFGTSTEIMLGTLSNNIYDFSSEELSNILSNIVTITENYCTSMDNQDAL